MDERQRPGASSGDDVPDPLTALLVRSRGDGEATIVRQLLASYGISCRLVSDLSQSLFPDGGREIRVLVAPARLAEARDLLAEHRREGLRSIPGGKRSVPREPR
jgi:hypothetical protein